MQTRKDQLQAHYFVVGRLVSALLRAEPDAVHLPLHRFTVGFFSSVMIAVIAVAGFGAWGFLFPGGSRAWQKPGALILEKETGSRYVFLDDQLRPVRNFASAKLLLGQQLQLTSVSKKSMRGVPHGLPVGIESAPDSLPEAVRLGGAQWQLCSALAPDITGADQPAVTVRIAPASTPGLPIDRALLVRTHDGTVYLAWNGERLRVPGGAALTALGYGTVAPTLVGTAWLNGLPAGPDLRSPSIPGLGGKGPTVDGLVTATGQVFVVRGAGGADQFFVALAGGLSPLSETDATLLLADDSTKAAYRGAAVRAVPLSPAAFGAAPRAATSTVTADLPSTPPAVEQAGANQVPCLHIAVGATDGATVTVALDPARSVPAVSSRRDTSTDGSTVDRVVVAPGGGLLARAQPGPGVIDGALYLVTDIGVKFALPTDDVVSRLGYASVRPVPVPTTLLALLPAGPVLDPVSARSGA